MVSLDEFSLVAGVHCGPDFSAQVDSVSCHQSPVSSVSVGFPSECTLLLPHTFPRGHFQSSALKDQFECICSVLPYFLSFLCNHYRLLCLCCVYKWIISYSTYLNVPKNTDNTYCVFTKYQSCIHIYLVASWMSFCWSVSWPGSSSVM